MVEGGIQADFFKWVRKAELIDPRLELLFAVPNGGKRDARTAARMKYEGVRPGIPDVLFGLPSDKYIGLAIEFKRPKGGSASIKQKRMMRQFTLAGWLVVIHTSRDEAVAEVKRYLQSATLTQNNFV